MTVGITRRSIGAPLAFLAVCARAIIGAGSTITRDVGVDSIAVERAHTSEKAGAAAKFRETRQNKTKPER